MKKALLYTLLFVLLTIVVFFAVIFVVPFLFWTESETGEQGATFLDRYPLFLPSLAVISWSVITIFIFLRNKYANIGFGNIISNDRVKIILLGGLSMLLLKTTLQPLLWISNNEVSESRYSIIQMWMHNDTLVIILLALIHITLETVFFAAILRELIIWSKRPMISNLVVALICTIPSFSDFSGATTLSLILCSFVPQLYGGWLYYKTGCIWPTVLGMVAYDMLMLLTPLFEYVSVPIVSAVTVPWLVIYLGKKISKNVKPVISQ